MKTYIVELDLCKKYPTKRLHRFNILKQIIHFQQIHKQL